jgi:hypothetical protein
MSHGDRIYLNSTPVGWPLFGQAIAGYRDRLQLLSLWMRFADPVSPASIPSLRNSMA